MSEKEEMLKAVNKMETPKETWQKLYSIKDLKIGYLTQFREQNDMTALRAFADDVNNPKSPLNKHPEDYEIWQIGEMCIETGEIKSKIKFIGRALDYVNTRSE